MAVLKLQPVTSQEFKEKKANHPRKEPRISTPSTPFPAIASTQARTADGVESVLHGLQQLRSTTKDCQITDDWLYGLIQEIQERFRTPAPLFGLKPNLKLVNQVENIAGSGLDGLRLGNYRAHRDHLLQLAKLYHELQLTPSDIKKLTSGDNFSKYFRIFRLNELKALAADPHSFITTLIDPKTKEVAALSPGTFPLKPDSKTLEGKEWLNRGNPRVEDFIKSVEEGKVIEHFEVGKNPDPRVNTRINPILTKDHPDGSTEYLGTGTLSILYMMAEMIKQYGQDQVKWLMLQFYSVSETKGKGSDGRDIIVKHDPPPINTSYRTVLKRYQHLAGVEFIKVGERVFHEPIREPITDTPYNQITPEQEAQQPIVFTAEIKAVIEAVEVAQFIPTLKKLNLL